MHLLAERCTPITDDDGLEPTVGCFPGRGADANITGNAGDNDRFNALVPEPLFQTSGGESTSRKLADHRFSRLRLEGLIDLPTGIIDGGPNAAAKRRESQFVKRSEPTGEVAPFAGFGAHG